MVVEKNALLAAGLTSMMWGVTGIFVRLLPPLSPLLVTAGRLLIALIAVVPVLVLYRASRQSLRSVLWRPVAYVLALLLAAYYLLATAAFQMAPVAEVALLLSTTPLFVLAFRKACGDRPTRSELGGALLAMSGIALILAPKMSLAGGMPMQHLTGNFLAICAAGLTAFYAYLLRRLSARGVAPETTGIAFLTFLAGSILLLLMVGLTSSASGWRSLDADALLMFVGLGVLCTAIPTMGFALAARRLPAVVTATISLFIPVFAGLFAFLILGEKIAPMFIPGGVLVLAGVAMILQQSRVKTTV
jgi:drug/metabolite transporter (DMT)-like permease